MEAAQEAPAPSREQLMTRRFELDSQIEECQRVTKVALEPLVTELQQTEQKIKASMIEGGEQQVKMADGIMCFFVTKDSVTVDDMDAVIDYMLRQAPPPPGCNDDAWSSIISHIERHAMFGLLNKAVNKTAAKEILETNAGVLPGIKYSSFKDLSWRRGKTA